MRSFVLASLVLIELGLAAGSPIVIPPSSIQSHSATQASTTRSSASHANVQPTPSVVPSSVAALPTPSEILQRQSTEDEHVNDESVKLKTHDDTLSHPAQKEKSTSTPKMKVAPTTTTKHQPTSTSKSKTETKPKKPKPTYDDVYTEYGVSEGEEENIAFPSVPPLPTPRTSQPTDVNDPHHPPPPPDQISPDVHGSDGA